MQQPPDRRNDQSWRFLIAVAIQTSTIVWWASNMSTRVSALESLVQANNDVKTRLTVVEVKQDAAKQTLDQMKITLDSMQKDIANLNANSILNANANSHKK